MMSVFVTDSLKMHFINIMDDMTTLHAYIAALRHCNKHTHAQNEITICSK